MIKCGTTYYSDSEFCKPNYSSLKIYCEHPAFIFAKRAIPQSQDVCLFRKRSYDFSKNARHTLCQVCGRTAGHSADLWDSWQPCESTKTKS